MKNGTIRVQTFLAFYFSGAPGRRKCLPVRLSRLASRSPGPRESLNTRSILSAYLFEPMSLLIKVQLVWKFCFLALERD